MQIALFLSRGGKKKNKSSASLIHFLQFGEISGNYFSRNEPLANFHWKEVEGGRDRKKKRDLKEIVLVTDTFPPRSSSCLLIPGIIRKGRSSKVLPGGGCVRSRAFFPKD